MIKSEIPKAKRYKKTLLNSGFIIIINKILKLFFSLKDEIIIE